MEEWTDVCTDNMYMYILPVSIYGNNVLFTSTWHSNWPLPFKSHDTISPLNRSLNHNLSVTVSQTRAPVGSREEISISLLREEEISDVIMWLVRFNWYSCDEGVLGEYSVQWRSLQGHINVWTKVIVWLLVFLFYLSVHEPYIYSVNILICPFSYPLNGLMMTDISTSEGTSLPLTILVIPSGYNLNTLHILVFPWVVRPTMYNVCAIQSYPNPSGLKLDSSLTNNYIINWIDKEKDSSTNLILTINI